MPAPGLAQEFCKVFLIAFIQKVFAFGRSSSRRQFLDLVLFAAADEGSAIVQARCSGIGFFQLARPIL
jgi:hypothetical protein